MENNVRIGTWYSFLNGLPDSYQTFTPVFHKLIDKISQGHQRVKGKYRSGGIWFLNRETQTRKPSSAIPIYAYGKKHYIGELTASVPSKFVVPSLAMPDLGAIGSDCWGRARPDKPQIDLGNAIYELKDVPEMLEHFTPALRKAPSAYLAIQFGWRPLMKDIRDTVSAVSNLAARYSQLVRDAGRPIRRSVEHTNESSAEFVEEYEDYGAFEQVFVTSSYHTKPVMTIERIYSKRIWYKGTYVYELPPIPPTLDFFDRRSRAFLSRMLNLRISPANVWKAIPWSWMADWFANVGSVLSNMDNAISDRCYTTSAWLMYHETSGYRFTARGSFRNQDDQIVSAQAVTEVVTEIKSRTIPDPFGLAARHGDYSPFQASILTALAISKRH